MKENKKIVLLILLGLLLLVGWFYWFQWRPVKIKQYCHQHAEENARVFSQNKGTFTEVRSVYDRSYEKCLHEKGLK